MELDVFKKTWHDKVLLDIKNKKAKVPKAHILVNESKCNIDKQNTNNRITSSKINFKNKSSNYVKKLHLNAYLQESLKTGWRYWQKLPSLSDLFKYYNFDTKISDIENEISEHIPTLTQKYFLPYKVWKANLNK